MTFSIIVPVYKVNTTYFKECIESILAQTFRDFELILVDDGSPDNCGQICDEWSLLDERIRVIHQENQGVSVARNSGIESAKGDWILFVDADDWLEANTCQILFDELSKNDCEIIMFHGIVESANGSKVMDYGLQNGYLYDLSVPENREFLYKRVMGISAGDKQFVSHMYYSWDKAYKRTFLLENELFYPKGIAKSEDKVFMCRCVEKTHKFYSIGDALYHYRMNEESVCHRYSAKIDENRILLAKTLMPIAQNMDKELAKVLNEPEFHKIYDEYMRFIFGLISDVLVLKFYHKDNPNPKGRRKAAIQFIKTEPFSSSINYVSYAKLSLVAKIKKVLLKCRCVSVLAMLCLRLKASK